MFQYRFYFLLLLNHLNFFTKEVRLETKEFGLIVFVLTWPLITNKDVMWSVWMSSLQDHNSSSGQFPSDLDRLRIGFVRHRKHLAKRSYLLNQCHQHAHSCILIRTFAGCWPSFIKLTLKTLNCLCDGAVTSYLRWAQLIVITFLYDTAQL